MEIKCDHLIKDSISFGVELECGKNAGDLDSSWEGYEEDDEALEERFSDEMIALLKKEDIPTIHHENFSGDWRRLKSWIVGYDGSISYDFKTEIRSPILKGESGLKKLLKVVRVLRQNKYRFNESCGLHVHIDMEDFSFKEIKNLIRFFVIYGDEINEYLPQHRKNNSYCFPIENVYGTKNKFLLALDNCEDKYDIPRLLPDRHTKINVTDLERSVDSKNIEFRQHHMTFEKEEIKNWIRFIAFIARESRIGRLIDRMQLTLKNKPSLNDIITGYV